MSKFNLIIKPQVTAGVERGGEDLDFYIEAIINQSEPPTQVDDFKLEWNRDGSGFSFDEEDDDDQVTIRTWYDEFEWQGKLNDVLDLEVGHVNPKPLKEALLDSERWVFDHRVGEPPRLAFRTKIFIDGNAE